MSSSATLAQVHFRFRTDGDGVGATPTWGAAEDVNYSIAVETNFRIRFVVQNTGTAAGAGPFILRVSKNAGAYTAVTTTSGATLGAQSADASTSADEVVIGTAGFRLTAGTGTSLAGKYDETGSATLSLTNGFFTEFEYGLILKTAGAAGGDTFDFRIYNSTTAFTTYTRTARVSVPDTVDDALANDISSASSVQQGANLKQVHNVLANDVASPSSVTKPTTLRQLHGLLANDVSSASNVSVPTAGIVSAATVAPQTMHHYRMRRAA